MLQALAQFSGLAQPRGHGGAASAHSSWFMAMLDEVDYGMLLVLRDGRVVHLNCIAEETLLDEHALVLEGERVSARRLSDAEKLRDALEASASRGLRRLLTIGGPACISTVAVIPLPATVPGSEPASLLVLGKRRVCEDLSVQWFARTHELTPGEIEVLSALCAGDTPVAIAKRRGVAVSTVRSQVAAIRVKTRADSVSALVRRVASLPPMVSALRGMGRAHAEPANYSAPMVA